MAQGLRPLGGPREMVSQFFRVQRAGFYLPFPVSLGENSSPRGLDPLLLPFYPVCRLRCLWWPERTLRESPGLASGNCQIGAHDCQENIGRCAPYLHQCLSVAPG